MKPCFASIVAITLVLTTLLLPVGHPAWAQQAGTTTPTAAAVVLAADALSRATPASGLFTDHDTVPPIVLDIDDDDLDRSRD